ncbi:MAG: hypothetical protein ACK40O_00940 [Allosphingosinicella sp.]
MPASAHRHYRPLGSGPAPLTPGGYLRRRREAADITIDELALAIASGSGHLVSWDERSALARRISLLEADSAGPDVDMPFILAIGAHVRLDEQVYLGLVGYAAAPNAGLLIPDHCRGCGCSHYDPCIDGVYPCAWSDGSKTICTACEGPTQPAIAAPAPAIAA